MSSATRAARRRAERERAGEGWHPDEEWQKSVEASPWPVGTEPPQCLRKGLLAALVGREPCGDEPPRWHISVQHRDRVPRWEEVVATAHELRPGICFVIGVPPRSWWMNVHPHVLHLWELRDKELVEQWRFEGQGHEPT